MTTHGGRTGTGIDAIAWAKEAADRGVGEILLNSIDADGTKDGFDLELIRLVRAAVKVPHHRLRRRRASPSTSRLPWRPARTPSWRRRSSTSDRTT